MKGITSDLNNSEVKSLHKVEVSLQVNIEISEDKKVTLGNIATVIKGLGIESKIAEQIFRQLMKKKLRGFAAINMNGAMVKIVINGAEPKDYSIMSSSIILKIRRLKYKNCLIGNRKEE